MKQVEFNIDTHDAIEFIGRHIVGDANSVRVCQELAVLAPLLWNENRPIIRLVDEPSLHHAMRLQQAAT